MKTMNNLLPIKMMFYISEESKYYIHFSGGYFCLIYLKRIKNMNFLRPIVPSSNNLT